jgi:DNA-binding transcriptional regulator YbjK
VEDILRLCIVNGNPDDKLTAAQCLASVNLSTSDIIHELLKNYFDAEDELTREQLILSLAKSSQRTVGINENKIQKNSVSYSIESRTLFSW